MIRGNFIVLEGIDGAGTTTQATELKRAYAAQGLPAHVTAEPSTGPVGSMIRQALSGRIVVRGPTGPVAPGWRTMALLFAADRQDHIYSEVDPNLRDGVNVICDRYVYSSLVYQGASATDAHGAEWIRQINFYARKPDLVLYLRVDPQIANKRRESRDRGIEIYEDHEFQHKLSAAYDELFARMPDVRITTIDGNRDVATVAAECLQNVNALRAEGAPE